MLRGETRGLEEIGRSIASNETKRPWVYENKILVANVIDQGSGFRFGWLCFEILSLYTTKDKGENVPYSHFTGTYACYCTENPAVDDPEGSRHAS